EEKRKVKKTRGKREEKEKKGPWGSKRARYTPEMNYATRSSYSHSLHRQIAVAITKQSYDESGVTISSHTGVKVPKRQMEQSVRRSAQDIELFYEQQRAASALQVKATGEILAISMDQKGVPMRKADLREATRKAAQERKPHLKHRRSKGEKSHSKRMSTSTMSHFTQGNECL